MSKKRRPNPEKIRLVLQNTLMGHRVTAKPVPREEVERFISTRTVNVDLLPTDFLEAGMIFGDEVFVRPKRTPSIQRTSDDVLSHLLTIGHKDSNDG